MCGKIVFDHGPNTVVLVYSYVIFFSFLGSYFQEGVGVVSLVDGGLKISGQTHILNTLYASRYFGKELDFSTIFSQIESVFRRCTSIT